MTSVASEPVEQAAQWHVIMQSGEADSHDEKAFYTWYSVPGNAKAYQRMDAIWTRFESVESALARSTLQQVLSEPSAIKNVQKNAHEKGRRSAGVIASASLAVCGFLFGLQTMPSDSMLAGYLSSGRLFSDYQTDVGEYQLVVLSDKTRIHLNTFSAINVEYTDTQRTIHLLQGEIKLDVAKDATRPLIVTSEQGSARALGTQFTVRVRDGRTDVTVTESRVQVCAETKNTLKTKGCEQLQAGEKTHISQHHVQPPQTLNPGFIRDWSRQQLIVDNQPVLNVLDELSRYQPGYMKINREALAQYTVSGYSLYMM